MADLLIFRTRAELRAWRDGLGAGRTLALVPTMGALHAGHAELLRRARASADAVVLTIFVNPAQFGPQEDLARYPRTLDADLAAARELRVDAVFAPEPAEVYPEGYSTWVEETRLSEPLCGRFRPGHFRGVATVVLKLFNLIRPHVAFFGLKDAQQFFVLSRMTRDLDLDIRLEGVPTVREPDGLALSSRNAYLTPSEREIAPLLQRTLASTARALEGLAGVRGAGEAGAVDMILETARAALETSGFRPQYLELLELPELARVSRLAAGRSYLLAAAAQLGSTRLIDNVIFAAAGRPSVSE